jgi:hypothetical protein
MAKRKTGVEKILLALGLKEYVKTASEDDIHNVMTSGIGLDAEPEAKDATHAKDCKGGDCKGCGGTGKDADETRMKFHKALDRMLDSKDQEQAVQDADMEELKGLFGASSAKSKTTEGLDEEVKPVGEEEETAATDDEEELPGEGEDEAVQSEASPKLPAEARTKPDVPAIVDAAFSEGSKQTLLRLRPFVAKLPKGHPMRGAFDSALTELRSAPKGSKGSYAAFVTAAQSRARGVGIDTDPEDKDAKRNTTADDAYAAERKRQRGEK